MQKNDGALYKRALDNNTKQHPSNVKAGVFSIVMHTLLLCLMLVTFNWKSTPPANIAEVELWDNLPTSQALTPTETAKPNLIDTPVKVVEPVKIAPPKELDKPVDEIPQEPKVDIALEKKKQTEANQAQAERLKKEQEAKLASEQQEKIQQADALKKLQATSREDATHEKALAKQAALKQKEALKKLQSEALVEDNNAGESRTKASATSADLGLITEYKNKIRLKIQGNVNNAACGDGNPMVRFEISLMPTGQLSGNPRLTKSSGLEACDAAVERAIHASEPLPLPDDAKLRSSFRDLNLEFYPNK